MIRQTSQPENALYQRVLELILSTRYPPGTKLSERSLMQDLDVGRIPLREVLFQLHSANLLSYELNKGFSIPKLSREELRQCYQVIWVLEGEVLRSGFTLLQSKTETLEEINQKFAHSADVHQALELDRRFHDVLVSGCQNHILRELLLGVKLRAHRYDQLFFLQPGLIRQSYQQHEQLIKAIGEGDREKAVEVLTANWRIGLEYLITRLL